MTTVELSNEMQDVLQTNILRFWQEKMIDHANGGFYGRIDGRGQLHPEAEKGAILNARILWTFSAAYRVLSHPSLNTPDSTLQQYLDVARRAKDYFVDHFLDPEYGGVFWSVDYKGEPLNTRKQFYAIGFALYGMTEFVRATGDEQALRISIELFECIEAHALDHEYNGYIEALSRSWQPLADMRLSELDANFPKSQNTHLHIIEPYANLYRMLNEQHEGSVSPIIINKVEKALRNIIGIFTDRILNPETHHLDLFFEMDWTRGAGHLESYGHDIECSWLMHEAALVLADEEVLKQVEPVVQMVAKASEKGIRPDGSMIHEANLTNGHVDDDLHWWVQAENVVGWYNIYQHFHQEEALQRSLHCWDYIKRQLIDWENGEWYWSRRPDGSVNTDDDKAGFWKCPYHNGRMCLEIIERTHSSLLTPHPSRKVI